MGCWGQNQGQPPCKENTESAVLSLWPWQGWFSIVYFTQSGRDPLLFPPLLLLWNLFQWGMTPCQALLWQFFNCALTSQDLTSRHKNRLKAFVKWIRNPKSLWFIWFPPDKSFILGSSISSWKASQKHLKDPNVSLIPPSLPGSGKASPRLLYRVLPAPRVSSANKCK